MLLLDEVLATGDATFRAKSQERVEELMRPRARHRPGDPRHALGDEFCNRAILLERGNMVAAGRPADVVAVHEERSAARQGGQHPDPLPPLST